MTSINAGGAFYRVQNQLNQNSERVSQSMQRLASGQQNISPGDRTSSTAVAFGMKAESASLKVGMQNGTEALQSIEMVTNDLAQLNDIVVRLEEIHALGANGFNTAQDTSALSTEATNLLAEMSRITVDAKWKGNGIMGAAAKANDMSFGRNTTNVDIKLPAFVIPEVALGFNTVGDSVYGSIDVSTGVSATGTAYASLTTTPTSVAARTLDTKPGDRAAQAALAINGAVFYEHLTGPAQALKESTVTAVPAAVSAQSGAQIAASALLTIGGSSAVAGAVTLDVARQVTLVSTASETSSNTKFTVVGTDANGAALSEEVTMAGASVTVSSTNFFKTIASITNNATASAGQITAGLGNKTAGGPVELAGSDIGSGSAEAALALLTLKSTVDTMNLTAGNLYNKVSNIMSHMGSLDAGYQLDFASKMDVNFAGETTELAKGQILAQAGTAMLAQANAQGQGMLALLQT